MDEEARRNALYGYQMTEPEIRVNAERYKVSHSFGADGVFFYAVRHHRVGCIVLIPQETWTTLDCGLKIAYSYNCVLERMEEVLRST